MSGRKAENAFLRFLKKLNNPPKWVEILVGAIALIALPLSIFILAIYQAYKVQAIIACSISSIIFLYSFWVTLKYVLQLRRKVLRVADKYSFTRNLHLSYEYRSIFISACAFLANIGYTVFLSAVAVLYDSIWYGALAVYYIMLAAARGSILVRNNACERKYKGDYHELQKSKVETYRYCGIMILALAVALGVSVVELLINGPGPRTADVFIAVFSVISVVKVVYGVMHFVRSTKGEDLVVRSVWYINLSVTLVSILTMQTIILSAYPARLHPSIYNGITGFSVCLITLALGSFMIIYSMHAKKRLLAREIHRAETIAYKEAEGYNRDGYVEEN